MTVFLLCDNGSVQSEATLGLRRIALQLTELSGKQIHPVSLMHANKIPAELINEQPAMILPDFLDQQLSSGKRNFCLIPLFFGNSRALTSYIPEKVQELITKHGPFSITIKDVLCPIPPGEPGLAGILIDHIKTTASDNDLPLKNIVLVDHGSPSPKVTAVREHIAETIEHGHEINLAQAVMERREGQEYDFNGPLLVDWLRKKAENGETSAIVAMMFLLPGKHAGPGGDIVTICQSVMDSFPNFSIAITSLVSEHPDLVNILLHRMESE